MELQEIGTYATKPRLKPLRGAWVAWLPGWSYDVHAQCGATPEAAYNRLRAYFNAVTPNVRLPALA